MRPQTIWQRARHPRVGTLATFAALGIAAAAFAAPVMAQTGNQAPVAQADTATTAEDTAVTVMVLANDSDSDGGTLTVTGLVAPTHGTAVINAGASVTYTPAANYNGSDTFTYTVADGQGGSATGTATITVTPANDPPTAVADAATAAAAAVTVPVIANDSDVDGDALTVSAVTQGAHGTAAISGTSVIYTPTAGYAGADTFTYTVSDGHGGNATASVAVTVTAANQPPVAVNDTVSVRKDTSKTINVLANDTDPNGGTLSVSATTPPAHGSVVVNANKTITYTPTAGYLGSDTFTYTVQDPSGATAVGTVNITVAIDALTEPTDKDACKKGGWVELGFRNQGQCVSASNHANHATAFGANDDDEDDDEDDDSHAAGFGAALKGKANGLGVKAHKK